MGGYEMLVTGDIMAREFRNSLSKPGRMVRTRSRTSRSSSATRTTRSAGTPDMVQIQSSWFPMFDRNPQTFFDIYHAKASTTTGHATRLSFTDAELEDSALRPKENGDVIVGPAG